MLEVVKYFIYFFSFVCKTKAFQSIDQDNNYFMGSSFKSINFGKAIQNAALHGTVLKTVLVETEFQCMMECVLHRPCLSYNFDTTSRESGYLCQLNEKDRFLGMLDFNTTMKGYLYRGIKTSCDEEPCSDQDSICNPSYETTSAQCVPAWLPVGDSFRSFSQIDSGNTGEVWGIQTDNTVYKLNTNRSGWTAANGGLTHVTSGKDCTWGVNSLTQIFYREVTDGGGTFWRVIGGQLTRIDCGLFGVVYGVDVSSNYVFYRAGITDANPTGSYWVKITDGTLQYVSCGLYGCWGVNHEHSVFLRANVTPQNPAGSAGFIYVSGMKLKQIECGADGVVWGITTVNEIVYRTNVTAANPRGDSWVKVPGTMVHVTVGCDAVYAIDTKKKVYIYVGKHFKKTSCL